MYKLTRFGDRKAQQEFRRGNTLIFSQNTASFTDVLPMEPQPCGAGQVSTHDREAESDPLQKMLRWLINESKNSAYSAVSFDGHRTARSTQFRCAQPDLYSFYGGFSFDFDFGFRLPLRYFNRDKPTFVIPTGDAPLWEPSDELVFSKLWPHLDPFGLVGFCVEPDLNISLDEQVKHLLNLYDSDFRCDPSFPVIVSNMLRRREFEIDMDVFSPKWSKNPKDTKRYKATTEAKKHTNRILAELQSVRDKFHGTTAQMLDMRSGIRGYVNAFGILGRIKDKFLDQADTVWANDKKSSNRRLAPKSLPEVPISQRQLKPLLIADFGERAMWVPGADDHMMRTHSSRRGL
ncbi:BZ3500_MvSof-1268-A1-R1_Chr11-3g03510 [Microbotryum saponariae]|uniref:BZ3500_MvSof-1268-A1-R1_Chr11-3g03510 protein n=1 Tax=Microbotryum saponariae TaxID=289078 RepID=A0A2X0LCP7_9BASI|nr:BZ3500_MvSof-1268-A1-R1_Chr11-3g03510 [Microbotryum saponariae]SDA03519.1 BZ3501_MvSof-1269-A2-R1_Chr11g03087 [Microbotryum saponariae]